MMISLLVSRIYLATYLATIFIKQFSDDMDESYNSTGI